MSDKRVILNKKISTPLGELFQGTCKTKVKQPYPWLKDDIIEENYILEISTIAGVILENIKYVEVDGYIFQIIGKIE